MASLRKRGKQYYASYYIEGRERRTSLDTTSYQVARERLRKLESSIARGAVDEDRPTRTPVSEIVGAYAAHLKTTKTKNGWKVDFWYLRRIFGPVCPLLESRRANPRREQRPLLHAACLEDVRTHHIAEFITQRIVEDGIQPKTANRYREILMRLFSWAMKQRGLRTPGGQNPAKAVERYRTPASKITFLTLEEIRVQLEALAPHPNLQTMIALYIYAGLRREEALWLTGSDVDLNAGRYGMIRVQAKTVLGESWEPKTKQNRAVPVSRALRVYLEAYTPPEAAGGWYFSSPKGYRWDPDNFSFHLRATNKAAGLS